MEIGLLVRLVEGKMNSEAGRKREYFLHSIVTVNIVPFSAGKGFLNQMSAVAGGVDDGVFRAETLPSSIALSAPKLSSSSRKERSSTKIMNFKGFSLN